MKKALLLAVGLGVAFVIERRADRLGVSRKAVILGALQDWLNRLSGRSAILPAEPADA